MQHIVLRAFFTRDDYMRKVVPFMEPSYFDRVHRTIFKEFVGYVAEYSNIPSMEAFRITMQESGNFNEDTFRVAVDMLPSLFETDSYTDMKWLMDQTEKWCQDRALFNAVMESISIIDGKHQSLTKNALPDILTKALSVTFDTNIGHDYLQDAESRYDFYH